MSTQPIPMVLLCPTCGAQHIDRPDTPEDGADWNAPEIAWTNPPHRSHLCHECGCIWRPADVATTGVAATETIGKADTWWPGIPILLKRAPPPPRLLPCHHEWVESVGAEGYKIIACRFCGKFY